MSIKLMTWVFDEYPSGGGEMLLALCLADFADDDGRRIFPSVETLGRKTRQSRRSVQTQLRRMETIGFVSSVGKTSTGTMEYRINLDFFEGAQNLRPPTEGRKSRLMGAQNTTKRGAKIAPNPPEPPLTQPPPDGGSGGIDLIYPRIRDAERAALEALLGEVPAESRQTLLDEIAGAIAHQKIKVGLIPFANGLARAVQAGRFIPSLGVDVAAARQAAATAANRPTAPFVADPAAQAAGEQILRRCREKACA